MKDSTTRQKLLYQGKMAIIACLCKLPRTQHDPLSFVVDVTVFTVSLSLSYIQMLLPDIHLQSGWMLMKVEGAFLIV